MGPGGEERFVTDETFAFYVSSYSDAVYFSDGSNLVTMR